MKIFLTMCIYFVKTMYVFMYVCMYLCMYVCMYVCMYETIVFMYVVASPGILGQDWVCKKIELCIYTFKKYVCFFVCMHVCMYETIVYMYVVASPGILGQDWICTYMYFFNAVPPHLVQALRFQNS